MPTSHVSARAERGLVVVEYKGSVIRKLEPAEALECGGEIEAVGKSIYGNRSSSSQSGRGEYPDNEAKSQRKQNSSRNDDNGVDDWRGDNKNSLINGSL